MAWGYAEFTAYSLFNGRFSDATAFPQTQVEAMLTLAYEVEGCRWADNAIALLVAHRLETLLKSGAAGESSSASLERYITPGSTLSSLNVAQGSNSASFNQPSGASNQNNRFGIGAGEDLSSTVWGQMLLSMRPKTFNVGRVI